MPWMPSRSLAHSERPNFIIPRGRDVCWLHAAKRRGIVLRGRGAGAFDELPSVLALARHPNIAVKASGMPAFSDQPYPFPDVHDAIHRLVDSYGPKRVFWGTDLTRMRCTYYECIRLFTEHQPWLRGDDLEWVMGRGVCEWLGWPVPPDAN